MVVFINFQSVDIEIMSINYKFRIADILADWQRLHSQKLIVPSNIIKILRVIFLIGGYDDVTIVTHHYAILVTSVTRHEFFIVKFFITFFNSIYFIILIISTYYFRDLFLLFETWYL